MNWRNLSAGKAAAGMARAMGLLALSASGASAAIVYNVNQSINGGTVIILHRIPTCS